MGSSEGTSQPHLDDLQCAYGCLEGFHSREEFTQRPSSSGFRHEETGSLTKQGADSTFLDEVLKAHLLSFKQDERGTL